MPIHKTNNWFACHWENQQYIKEDDFLTVFKIVIKVILLIVKILESTEKDKEAHTQISPEFTTQRQPVCGVFSSLLSRIFFFFLTRIFFFKNLRAYFPLQICYIIIIFPTSSGIDIKGYLSNAVSHMDAS